MNTLLSNLKTIMTTLKLPKKRSPKMNTLLSNLKTIMTTLKLPKKRSPKMNKPTAIASQGAAEFSSKNLPPSNKPETPSSLLAQAQAQLALSGSRSWPPGMSTPFAGSAVKTLKDPPPSVDPMLVEILSWRRRHDSAGEKLFLEWLDKRIADFGFKSTVAAAGCRMVTVLRKDKTMSTTLFSCHVDTVDGKPNTEQDHKQTIVYDPNFGDIFLDDKATNGTCLGADDGVGVWIMLRMIEAKVPGTYLFHRGEEVGGIGAKAVRDSAPGMLKLHKRAIAFDRANENEVIITQGGAPCASETFGKALAAALNTADDQFDYAISRGGVYTDTKEYRGLIPECVNLGVGYQSQHGPKETLSYRHAYYLLKACISVDWESLPTERKATIETYNHNSSGYAGSLGRNHSDPFDTYNKTKKTKKRQSIPTSVPSVDILEEIWALGDLQEIEAFVEEDPTAAAKMLGQLAAALAAERGRNETLGALLGF